VIDHKIVKLPIEERTIGQRIKKKRRNADCRLQNKILKSLFVKLPFVCLSASLSAYLSVCQPICLSVRLTFCCLSGYLSVCLYACLTVMSICLFGHLSVCSPACLSIRLSVCLSAFLSVCLSAHLSVCLPTYLKYLSAA
jgi:hypothetical protein